MLMLFGDAHYLRHFGFCNFEVEDPADALALRVDFQHNLGRAGTFHAENCLQYIDNELHGREVIIYQDHPVQWRLLEFRARFFDSEILAVVSIIVSRIVTHRSRGMPWIQLIA